LLEGEVGWRPSTKICGHYCERVTLPSISTFTEGTFFITSTAVPPARYDVFIHVEYFTVDAHCSYGLDDVTVTLPNTLSSISNRKLPKSLSNAPAIVAGLPPSHFGRAFQMPTAVLLFYTPPDAVMRKVKGQSRTFSI
jgi:hypothetical protein